MMPQLYTKSYKQLRDAERGRDRLLQGGAHQLVMQYQMASPENMLTINIIQTEKVIIRNIYNNIS